MRDTDVDGFHTINTPNPIDLNTAVNCTFKNVTASSEAKSAPVTERTSLRKYFGGFSFSKGDHLKKKD